MSDKKIPVGLLALIPNLISGVVSIVKDKRGKGAESNPSTPETVIADSISAITSGTLSSKRLLNIGGFGAIIYVALHDIAINWLTRLNLGLIAVGALYSVCMAFITYLSERENKA